MTEIINQLQKEDVCVLASVLDALEEGFEVFLLKDATRPLSADACPKAESVTLVFKALRRSIRS